MGDTNYHVKSFRWADTEYSPHQLENLYSRRLPFLVMTTRGFMGRNAENAVATDELYWLKKVIKQPRVVVCNRYNKYYSIPLYYPRPVITTKDSDGQWKETRRTTIAELAKKNKRVEFSFEEGSSSASQTVYEGASVGSSVDLGTMEIVDRYDERYLLVHSIISGHLSSEATVVPLYMPISFVIAVGLGRSDHRDFYRTMLNMNSFVKKHKSNPTQYQHASEILVYEEKPNEGEYDHIEPKGYISLQRTDHSNPDNSLYATLFQPGNHADDETSTDPPSGSLSVSALTKELNEKLGMNKEMAKKRTSHKINPRKNPAIENLLGQVNRGGTRGPDTNIACKHKTQGFHITDRHPDVVLEELHSILKKGEVPKETAVSSDQWTDSEGEMDTRPRRKYSLTGHQDTRNIYTADPTTTTETPGDNQYYPLSPSTYSYSLPNDIAPPPPPPDYDEDRVPPRPERTVARLDLQSSQSVVESNGEYAYQMQTNSPQGNQPVYQDQNIYQSPRAYRKPPQVKPKPIVRAQSTGAAINASIGSTSGTDGASWDIPVSPTVTTTFTTLDDVPRDISCLSVRDMQWCLLLLNLENFVDTFEHHQIDGGLLLSMDKDMLVSEFNFSPFQAMKLIRFAKDGWRPSKT